MSSRRLLLHDILCGILSCPNNGDECRVYFQPPASIQMKYPAIMYSLENIENEYADDGVYLSTRKYMITLITRDPDTVLIGQLSQLPKCRFVRPYTESNLNHYVFELYY